jgi:hypothetical protein
MGQEMPESIRMIDQHCEIAITLPPKAKPKQGSRDSIFGRGMDWEEGLLVNGWCIAEEKLAEPKILEGW